MQQLLLAWCVLTMSVTISLPSAITTYLIHGIGESYRYVVSGSITTLCILSNIAGLLSVDWVARKNGMSRTLLASHAIGAAVCGMSSLLISLEAYVACRMVIGLVSANLGLYRQLTLNVPWACSIPHLIGIMSGPVIGAFLYNDTLPHALGDQVMCTLNLISFVCLAMCSREQNNVESLSPRTLRPYLSIVIFMYQLFVFVTETTLHFSVYNSGIDAQRFGVLLAISNTTAIVTACVVSRLPCFSDGRTLFTISCLLVVVNAMLIPQLFESVCMTSALMLLNGFAYGASAVVVPVYFIRHAASVKDQTTLQLISAIAVMVASCVIGGLWSAFPYVPHGPIVACVSVPAILIVALPNENEIMRVQI